MKLYLVQHGEAVEGAVDPGRPLTAAGKDAVAQVAAALLCAGASPERLVHSGKTRARQTAEIMEKALRIASGPKETPGIAPMDPVAEFCRRLPELGAEAMVCGHQPFMGRLVSYLLTGDQDKAIVEYSPGSVACLENNAAGGWVLVSFLRPEFCPRRT